MHTVNCNFCKKTREKILKGSDTIKHYLNVQKILDMKNLFKKQSDQVYNFTSKIINKNH